MYIDKSNGIKLHEKGDDQIIIIIVIFVTDTFFSSWAFNKHCRFFQPKKIHAV